MIGSQILTDSDVQSISTVEGAQQLGALGLGKDGSRYVYAKAGGTATKGKIVVAGANVANHLGLAPANADAGVVEISLTLGGTAATKDQYQGGKIVVEEGTGIGQTIGIIGNAAQTSTSGVVKVKLARPLQAALAASDSKVSLYPNRYNGVATSATAALRRVGVTVADVQSGDYCWLQTSGPCGVLVEGSAVALADPVIPSATTAGAVEGIGSVAATDQVVGFALDAGTDDKHSLVDLCIS